MLTAWLSAAMSRAHYEILTEDGGFYGEIPGFDGVWASAASLEACRTELAEVLEDWLLVRVAGGLPVPDIDGLSVHVRQVA